jgi:hypothetical protein
MSNNTTPHTPATPVVAPAKDNAAAGQTQTQKTAPIDSAPKAAPAVVPTPKV